MSAALTASHPAPVPDADEDPALLRPVRRVLRATVAAADLITLELQVPGLTHLSLLVRSRAVPEVPGLVLWPTTIPPCTWHQGVLLVATAAAVDAPRRVAVHSAGVLINDLLTAELRRRDAELLASRAVELAGVDALTGLGNRRTWRAALDEESLRSARYDRPCTVVVVDLDGLKRINDEQGHAAGDAHLQRAAAAVRAASRSVDVVCRLGGDEFGVLAPETGCTGAAQLAARLRAQLDDAGVSASIGVATASRGELEQAWQVADQEMYLHKRRRH